MVQRSPLARSVASLLAVLLVVLGAGCAGLRHQTAARKSVVTGKVPQVHAAVLAVVRDWQLKPSKQLSDKLTGRVDGHFGDGTSFSIVYDQVTERSTEISVLVGAFGDRDRSLRLLEAIENELPKGQSRRDETPAARNPLAR